MLVTNNMKMKILFTIVSKSIKYVGTNLTNEVSNLYSEIIKTLLVEIKGPKEMERYPLFIDHKI